MLRAGCADRLEHLLPRDLSGIGIGAKQRSAWLTAPQAPAVHQTRTLSSRSSGLVAITQETPAARAASTAAPISAPAESASSQAQGRRRGNVKALRQTAPPSAAPARSRLRRPSRAVLNRPPDRPAWRASSRPKANPSITLVLGVDRQQPDDPRPSLGGDLHRLCVQSTDAGVQGDRAPGGRRHAAWRRTCRLACSLSACERRDRAKPARPSSPAARKPEIVDAPAPRGRAPTCRHGDRRAAVQTPVRAEGSVDSSVAGGGLRSASSSSTGGEPLV